MKQHIADHGADSMREPAADRREATSAHRSPRQTELGQSPRLLMQRQRAASLLGMAMPMPLASAWQLHQAATQGAGQPAVAQRGGSKWTPHSDRQLIEKRWEKSGYACFYTKDDSSFYSEAWVGEKDNIQYAGAVQIEPKGEFLALHTRSEHGMEGGLGIYMMSEAVKLVAQFHRDYAFVQMTPAPGAASKKVIEILSAQIGTPEIHEKAVETQKLRQKWQKTHPADHSAETEEERVERLQTWSPESLPEHMLHLESLVASSDTEGVQVTGPAGGLIGFDANAMAPPSAHIETISSDEHASGYGIYIPMAKFLKVAKGF